MKATVSDKEITSRLLQSTCIQLHDHGTSKHTNEIGKGSRIRVISSGPFRGLKGTVRTVDTIFADGDEPFCFYLIVLEGAYSKEPIWFQCDEVELVSALMQGLPELEYPSHLGRPHSCAHLSQR